jgi:hypothetical protein
MTTKQLHFKWTISRGRDTYGYNICTLLVDGEKVSKTCGGGYDMQGTVLAQWIENEYQKQLQEYFKNEISAVTDKDYTAYSGNCYKSINGFYGAHISGREGRRLKITLDGGCGFNSIEHVAKAIGISLKWNPESNKYKNHTYYTAIINN